MKDLLRDKFVRKCGFIVIRIKNEDVCSFDYSKLLNYKDFDAPLFRTGLALANSYKGVAMKKTEK